MNCSNCGYEVAIQDRYCQRCGALQTVPEDTVLADDASAEERLQQLSGMVAAQNAELVRMSQRLAALETGRTAPGHYRPPIAHSASSAPSGSATGADLIGSGTSSENIRTSATQNWEWLLGANWLARVGIAALILGVAFFIGMAIDRGWLNEWARVVLGVVTGSAFMVAGEYFRKRYAVWSQAVTGGGMAILFLSVYGAFALYGLISSPIAFGAFALITLAGALLSLRYESMSVAVLSIIGGFATPLLLEERPPEGRLLLSYVLVLDVGVLGLASFRNWRWFTLLGLAGSIALFGFWHEELNPSLALAQVGITAIFLIFAAATIVFHIARKQVAGAADLALMTLNAAAYYGISYTLMHDSHQPWMGGFTALLAVFYVLQAGACRMLGEEQRNLTLFSAGLAAVFAVLVVPVQLDGLWISMGWGVEALVLMWLSSRLGMHEFRWASYLVLAAMLTRLILFDTFNLDLDHFIPIINWRFISFAAGIATLYLAAWLVARGRRDDVASRFAQYEAHGPIILLALANFATLWILSVEILASADSARFDLAADVSDNLSVLGLSLLWGVYSAALIMLGVLQRWRRVRLAGLALLSVAVIKLFLYDSQTLEQEYRVIAFVALGTVLLACGMLYQRYKSAVRGFLFD